MAIVASGPSFTQADADRLKGWREKGQGRKVVAINSSFGKVPFADVIYAGDYPWWKFYIAKVRASCRGEYWTVSSPAATRLGLRRIMPVMPSAQLGLSRKPGYVTLGGNSGYQAVGLAVQFGAKRLILLGFDMQRTGGKTHHHGDHPRPLGNGNNFAAWVRRFDALAPQLLASGVRVVNATRSTALKCFPRLPIEKALA